MSLDWILSPLAVYGAVGAGISCCVYLFFSLNAEIQHVERRIGGEIEDLRAVLKELDQKLAAEMDDRIAMLAPAALSNSVNLTKRAQALRMHRRGETSEAIAAALGLAQSEVDLIVKVQRIVLASLGGGSPRPEGEPAAPGVVAQDS